MKQTFKLTESELHNLISECITEAIEDEGLGSFLGGMAKKFGRDAGSAMSKMGNKVAQGARNMAQGARNAYQGAKEYGQSLYNAGVQASNVADAQTAIKTIQGLVQKGILGQNIANMVIGNLRKYGNQ